jgi:hypothetical protein
MRMLEVPEPEVARHLAGKILGAPFMRSNRQDRQFGGDMQTENAGMGSLAIDRAVPSRSACNIVVLYCVCECMCLVGKSSIGLASKYSQTGIQGIGDRVWNSLSRKM